jgi:hypothetical protein
MSFQIPIFCLSDSTDPASVRRKQIIAAIRDSSPLDQGNAIAEPHREAQASAGDERAWNDLTLGLFQARQFEDACELFRKLSEAFPDHDLHCLNLATCYSQMAQLDLCQYELDQVKNNGRTEDAPSGRKAARGPLPLAKSASAVQQATLTARSNKMASFRLPGDIATLKSREARSSPITQPINPCATRRMHATNLVPGRPHPRRHQSAGDATFPRSVRASAPTEWLSRANG